MMTASAGFVKGMLLTMRIHGEGEYVGGDMGLEPMAVWLGFALGMVALLLVVARVVRDRPTSRGRLVASGTVVAAAVALVGGIALMVMTPLVTDIWATIQARTWLTLGFVLALDAMVLGLVAWYPRLGSAQVAMGVATFVVFLQWSLVLLAWGSWSMAMATFAGFGGFFALAPLLMAQRSLETGREAGAWRCDFATMLMGATVGLGGLRVMRYGLPLLGGVVVAALVSERWREICLLRWGKDGRGMPRARVNWTLLAAALGWGLAITLNWVDPIDQWYFSHVEELISRFRPEVFFGAMFCYGLVARLDRERRGLVDARVGGWVALVGWMGFALLMLSAWTLLPPQYPEDSSIFGTEPLPAEARAWKLGLMGLGWALFLMGLAWKFRIPRLVAAAILGLVAMECDPYPKGIGGELWWYVMVWGILVISTMVWGRWRPEERLPWAASAVGLVGHVTFMYLDWSRNRGMSEWSYLERAILAVMPFLGLVTLAWAAGRHRRTAEASGTTATRSRWPLLLFGGVALITMYAELARLLSFEWYAVSWSLVGLALCWLGRRQGSELQEWTGLGTLGVVFVMLTLNPLIMGMNGGVGPPLLNGYWATHATVALIFGWVALGTRERGLRGVLWTCVGLLSFQLMNLEIHAWFQPSPPAAARVRLINGVAAVFNVDGSRWTPPVEPFSGGEDLAIGIGWGLFALALLALGRWKKWALAYWAGVGLTGLTLVGLTLLALRLQNLGTLGKVAVVLVVVGFAVWVCSRGGMKVGRKNSL